MIGEAVCAGIRRTCPVSGRYGWANVGFRRRGRVQRPVSGRRLVADREFGIRQGGGQGVGAVAGAAAAGIVTVVGSTGGR